MSTGEWLLVGQFEFSMPAGDGKIGSGLGLPLSNRLNFAGKGGVNEGDQKVFKESVHSEQARNREVFFETRLNLVWRSINIKSHRMNP